MRDRRDGPGSTSTAPLRTTIFSDQEDTTRHAIYAGRLFYQPIGGEHRQLRTTTCPYPRTRHPSTPPPEHGWKEPTMRPHYHTIMAAKEKPGLILGGYLAPRWRCLRLVDTSACLHEPACLPTRRSACVRLLKLDNDVADCHLQKCPMNNLGSRAVPTDR